MDRKVLWAGLLSLVVIGMTALIWVVTRPVSFRGTSYGEPYPKAAEIELTRSNGDVFHLSDQKGHIVLLFFGYTSCPDVCPTTLAELNQVMGKLGDNARQVQVVFVFVLNGLRQSSAENLYIGVIENIFKFDIAVFFVKLNLIFGERILIHGNSGRG